MEKGKNFREFALVKDMHGDVLLPGALSNLRTDLARGKDKNAHVLFYDCMSCFGKGCDICGGTGQSNYQIDAETLKRYQLLDHKISVPIDPKLFHLEMHFPELKFIDGEFVK